ncbi:hypothetical protein EGR_01218 [Echinococcus granulosus]|uniref:Uncharacterized protein n=1 Tax=Echinococcus granulosus TaxID=6210 RepID=W6UQV9_ECHGR|nr:hypothetical protein EGR_01218 [Echinococcus granulosus]EUB64090.1 hypothetical protein EGR_01218 [Echinococcus granulosus]
MASNRSHRTVMPISVRDAEGQGLKTKGQSNKKAIVSAHSMVSRIT